VTHQENTRPVEQTLPQFRIGLGKEGQFPLSGEFPEAELPDAFPPSPDTHWIHQGDFQEAAQRDFYRQHDLRVIRRMKCILVVIGMACPEKDRVVSTQEAEHFQKEYVEESGFENRQVAEFVKAVQKKCVAGAVKKQRKKQIGPVEIIACVPSERTRECEDTKVSEGL
jgi:hypothetical protein